MQAAMLSVASFGEESLIGRDARKSVVSGLILSGIRPVRVEPNWDAERRLAHPPSPRAVEDASARHLAVPGVRRRGRYLTGAQGAEAVPWSAAAP